MLTYQKLARNPLLPFRCFTGLTVEEFNNLYDIAESQYAGYELEKLDRKDRIKVRIHYQYFS